jgi:hypothetical protein
MPRMLRPKATVLPDAALVPAANLRPPPRRYTHKVVSEQPFHFAEPQAEAAADGCFAPGTKLLLLAHDGGPWCQVQDGQGLCATTAWAGLRELR